MIPIELSEISSGAVTLPYHCIVLVKQVPDTANITSEAMKADGTVNRGALPTIFNPEDLNALEVALEVRDRFGGTVTAVSMGPPKAADVLRSCLFRGADRAILLTDRRAAASDTLATSYILAQVIKKIGRLRPGLCRSPGDRRRHRAGRASMCREARGPPDYLLGRTGGL